MESRANGVGFVERRTRGLARFSPPRAQDGHVDRPRISALLDAAARRERVIVVAAPSGYGKTSAVRGWAAESSEPVAWLSLGPFDGDDELVTAGVLRALGSVMPEAAFPRGGESASYPQGVSGAARVFEQLFDELTEPVTLVIDDAHRAGDALRTGLLGALVDGGPEQLRLVIVGTTVVETELSRLVLTHPDAVIRAPQLAFDLDEIAALAGPDHPRSPVALREVTQGWPIAVRLLCLPVGRAGAQPDVHDLAILRDYLRDHVLGTLRPELQDFALDTAIGIDLTAKLAAAISGVEHAECLLEECARLGLFLDRVDTGDGVVYRWHAIFVRQCRAILEASDPGRLRQAHRRAAAFLETGDPLNAIVQLLAGDSPAEALAVLLRHWRWLLVGVDPGTLDQVCTSLPEPYHDDPRVLLLRACAQEVGDARQSAHALAVRAQARAAHRGASEDFDYYRHTAQLLSEDDPAELTALSRTAYEALNHRRVLPARERLATLYLIGWAGMRARRDPAFFGPVVAAAVDEAEALGEFSVARPALGQQALFLAWRSRLASSKEALRRLDAMASVAPESPLWRAYAGGSGDLAVGLVALFGNEMMEAQDAFVRVIGSGSLDATHAGVARCLLAFAASSLRDADGCARAAREVQAIPREDSRGLPWRIYRNAALAALYEADGQRDRAVRIAERAAAGLGHPMMTALLTDIVRRGGKAGEALKLLMQLKPYHQFGYVRVPLLATAALVRHREGDVDEAHRLCELAVQCAVGEGIRYTFCNGEPELRQLLSDHLAWGTQFEEFVLGCLSSSESGRALELLSERERSVFAQLRTTKTNHEIADALGVSINTVKTHQRAVYRKLGVTSRPEAVRKFG